MPTPLQQVKSRFETKANLVEAVEKLMTDDLWIPRLSSDRDGAKGLANVSNKKLLRLHDVLTEVKNEFGSRAKLIDAVMEVEGRAKDADYRTRLEAYAVPRLYDQYKSGKKRAAKAN